MRINKISFIKETKDNSNIRLLEFDFSLFDEYYGGEDIRIEIVYLFVNVH